MVREVLGSLTSSTATGVSFHPLEMGVAMVTPVLGVLRMVMCGGQGLVPLQKDVARAHLRVRWTRQEIWSFFRLMMAKQGKADLSQ